MPCTLLINIKFKGDYNMTPDRHLGAAWIGNGRFEKTNDP